MRSKSLDIVSFRYCCNAQMSARNYAHKITQEKNYALEPQAVIRSNRLHSQPG